MEIEDQAQLLEWFANNYKNFGTTLQIVTDKSQEGSQFCKGFGGIGGMLLFLQSKETDRIHKLNTFRFKII